MLKLLFAFIWRRLSVHIIRTSVFRINDTQCYEKSYIRCKIYSFQIIAFSFCDISVHRLMRLCKQDPMSKQVRQDKDLALSKGLKRRKNTNYCSPSLWTIYTIHLRRIVSQGLNTCPIISWETINCCIFLETID